MAADVTADARAANLPDPKKLALDRIVTMLASISTVTNSANILRAAGALGQTNRRCKGLSPNHGMGVGSSARRDFTRMGLWARLSNVTSTRSESIATVAETSKRLVNSFLACA